MSLIVFIVFIVESTVYQFIFNQFLVQTQMVSLFEYAKICLPYWQFTFDLIGFNLVFLVISYVASFLYCSPRHTTSFPATLL